MYAYICIYIYKYIYVRPYRFLDFYVVILIYSRAACRRTRVSDARGMYLCQVLANTTNCFLSHGWVRHTFVIRVDKACNFT